MQKKESLDFLQIRVTLKKTKTNAVNKKEAILIGSLINEVTYLTKEKRNGTSKMQWNRKLQGRNEEMFKKNCQSMRTRLVSRKK